jgi:hypothetical protein
LNDEVYAIDVEACEVYIDSAKRAIYRATRTIDSNLSDSMSSMSLTSTPLAPYTPIAPTIKLPTINLEPFPGDIVSWPRFWEQFHSFVYTNPSASRINKHVFLKSYFEGDPNHLVDGIAVSAET